MQNKPSTAPSLTEAIPLTSSQRGIYFACAAHPESTVYNNPFALPLPSQTNLERFAQAVEQAAALHPALYAVVRMESDGPVMLPGQCAFSLTRERRASKTETVESFIRPFDLENGPLFHFTLSETPEGAFFLFDVHHLIFDGTSLKQLLTDITAFYAGDPV